MNQRGFITPNMYAFLGLLLVAALVYGYVQTLRLKAERLETENAVLVRDNVLLKTQAEVKDKLAEAETIRAEAARDAQIESSIRAEREKQRVTVERLTAASLKKAKLVEKAAHRAIEHNMKTLECKTDLRTSGDTNACPDHVR